MIEVENATISKMKELRRSETTVTYYMEFKIEVKQMMYKPFDSFAIFPENDPKCVETIATAQGWELDRKFVLKLTAGSNPAAGTPKYPFPMPITIRDALTRFCDLNGLLS